MQIINKYLAALLSVLIVAGTAFIALPDHSVPTSLQFGALVLSTIVTYVVPLVPGVWAGVLKTGLAVVLGIVGALVPLLATGHLTASQWIIVGLAGLNALAVQIGVVVRTDAAILAGKPLPGQRLSNYQP